MCPLITGTGADSVTRPCSLLGLRGYGVGGLDPYSRAREPQSCSYFNEAGRSEGFDCLSFDPVSCLSLDLSVKCPLAGGGDGGGREGDWWW